MEDLKQEIATLKIKVEIQNTILNYLIAMQGRESGVERINQIFQVIESAFVDDSKNTRLVPQEVTEYVENNHQLALSFMKLLGVKSEPLPSKYDQGVEAGWRAILLAIIKSHPNEEEVLEYLKLASDKYQSKLLFDIEVNDLYQLGLSQTLEVILSSLERKEDGK